MECRKEIFLSFRPEFFRPILYNIKKYEYRKRFCDEPTKAFLYLSSPVQKVVGIMELGKPIHMDKIINNYQAKEDIYKRIMMCLENKERYAIPIKNLRLYKNPIPIEKLTMIDNKFKAPRCYLNIKKYDKIYNYLINQQMHDIEFRNNHEKIYKDNFAMSCRDIQLTEEFQIKDKKYTSQDKYKVIDCGYII